MFWGMKLKTLGPLMVLSLWDAKSMRGPNVLGLYTGRPRGFETVSGSTIGTV